MRTLFRLSLLGVALTGSGGVIRAEGPTLPAAPPVEVVEAPAPGTAADWPVYPGSPATPTCSRCKGAEPPPNGFHRWIRHPLGCWASHNCPTCSSLHSDCIFLFGSCREFFDEPCRKGPPPLPPYPY